MADFHQPRFVPTLHAFGGRRPRTEEVSARAQALGRSVTLVLPALASEVDGPAFPRMIGLLERNTLLDRVILVLGAGTADQECRAEDLVSRLRARVTLIRLGDPGLGTVPQRLATAGFDCQPIGKGYACWVGVCAALAAEGSDIIAMHDCDILTYHPSMVARLVAPLLLPETPFDFAKGFYPRVTSTLHGRVTRLLMAPLLRAFQAVGVTSTLPSFLADFRYPFPVKWRSPAASPRPSPCTAAGDSRSGRSRRPIDASVPCPSARSTSPTPTITGIGHSTPPAATR